MSLASQSLACRVPTRQPSQNNQQKNTEEKKQKITEHNRKTKWKKKQFKTIKKILMKKHRTQSKDKCDKTEDRQSPW